MSVFFRVLEQPCTSQKVLCYALRHVPSIYIFEDFWCKFKIYIVCQFFLPHVKTAQYMTQHDYASLGLGPENVTILEMWRLSCIVYLGVSVYHTACLSSRCHDSRDVNTLMSRILYLGVSTTSHMKTALYITQHDYPQDVMTLMSRIVYVDVSTMSHNKTALYMTQHDYASLKLGPITHTVWLSQNWSWLSRRVYLGVSIMFHVKTSPFLTLYDYPIKVHDSQVTQRISRRV